MLCGLNLLAISCWWKKSEITVTNEIIFFSVIQKKSGSSWFRADMAYSWSAETCLLSLALLSLERSFLSCLIVQYGCQGNFMWLCRLFTAKVLDWKVSGICILWCITSTQRRKFSNSFAKMSALSILFKGTKEVNTDIIYSSYPIHFPGRTKLSLPLRIFLEGPYKKIFA